MNLAFIALPLVGAFIGYSTNVVAVKMLFRPLSEVRVFGIRLPFTPGILPRQRRHLAENIGEMVERELFTAQILRQRLDGEEVKEKIRLSISLFTEKILAGNVSDLLPEKTPASGGKNFINEKIIELVGQNYPSIAEAVLVFLRTGSVRRQLEAKGHTLLRKVMLKLNPLQRMFVSAANYDLTLSEKMPEIIEDLIANAEDFLKEDAVKKALLDRVESALDNVLGSQNKTIGETLKLDEGGKKKLDDRLFEQLQAVMDVQIEKLLAAVNVKEMVRERIDSLDMLRVEKIILDIMANQFKWIHFFGGVLGFLIGLVQILFVFLLGG